jgi:hypothetical protein
MGMSQLDPSIGGIMKNRAMQQDSLGKIMLGTVMKICQQ